MHGPCPRSTRVAHLVDRQPDRVPRTADRPADAAAYLRRGELRDLSPRPGRADPVGRRRGLPAVLPSGLSNAAAGRKKLFGRREVLPGVGLYLDGGFGVGKTHLLAAAYRAAAVMTPPIPKRSRRSWS